MIDKNSTALDQVCTSLYSCNWLWVYGLGSYSVSPLDCISNKGSGSYNLALEAKALMTPALMAPAICRSGSLWFRLLQLGIAIVEKCTKQGKTYSVTSKTDAKKHNCNIEEKVHTELLLLALLLRTCIRNPCLLITALYYIRHKDNSYIPVGSTLVYIATNY